MHPRPPSHDALAFIRKDSAIRLCIIISKYAMPIPETTVSIKCLLTENVNILVCRNFINLSIRTKYLKKNGQMFNVV